ncbi:MAG: carboxyvinyl-carboxyphosphonate phosphorylmutase [Dehalococcoidia bacterium]|nr:MAG: carboxyvinyl-carboxyphosphonate phosphorylmutase [Dehalococcoidia bacterium]
MGQGTALRNLLAAGPVLAPGAYDALSAKLLERAGFSALYRGGYSVAASRYGLPDIGLVGREEMAEHARTIVDAVRVPVLADADDGYGGPAGAARTVQRFEQAGVAAIQIEDQLAPKRCGHLDGKRLISADEMLEKLAAALAVRRDALIIARTDAVAVEGLDAAIERANRYAAAGADLIFVDAPRTVPELERIGREVDGVLMVCMAENELTPLLPFDELIGMGYRVVIHPSAALFTAAAAVAHLADVLAREKTTLRIAHEMFAFKELNALLELDAWQRLDRPVG